jgi:hypothetical protein
MFMSITKHQALLDDIKSVLGSFHIITLQEMEQSHLMSRFDEKYVFRISRLRQFLIQLLSHYKILSVHGQVMSRYENMYFDTPELKSYHDHHNDRANRYKIRFRSYSDSGDCFFEIKKKDNRGYTSKVRQHATTLQRSLSNSEIDFIKKNLNGADLLLQPSLSNSFNRITFVNTLDRERLTLDILTRFKNVSVEKKLDDVVIAEVKQEHHLYDSAFKRLMQHERIFPVSFSKYCIGTLLTHTGIKYNRFKPKLTIINKLNNDLA